MIYLVGFVFTFFLTAWLTKAYWVWIVSLNVLEFLIFGIPMFKGVSASNPFLYAIQSVAVFYFMVFSFNQTLMLIFQLILKLVRPSLAASTVVLFGQPILRIIEWSTIGIWAVLASAALYLLLLMH